MTADCQDCEATGFGPCANCGDGHTECACDEQEETDCDTCGGTGKVSLDEQPDQRDDFDWEPEEDGDDQDEDE